MMHVSNLGWVVNRRHSYIQIILFTILINTWEMLHEGGGERGLTPIIDQQQDTPRVK